MKLLISGLVKFLCGLLLVGVLLFLPAGTLQYPEGLLFMGLLFVPMLVAGFVMYAKNPALLQRRLDAKEKQSTQKGVLAFAGLMFIGSFVVAGLDFRFGWTRGPLWVTIVASALFLTAYGLYAEVLRENAYLSRTVKVEEGQTVVDTGLYGIVRHPMYAVTILLFLMMPLVLGSWFALIPMAFYPVIIVIRLLAEEKLLAKELPGYEDYQKKVKYRLIPFVW